ncbi:MAG: 6-pyruvoyl trahydropterin synthase family protein [Fimbriimonas sp.]
MARYRVCKTFTVESGHMLSKHPGRCRFPHGHTRTIEVVVSAEELDQNQMVVDFKALKLAVENHIKRYDHSLAINSKDPLVDAIASVYPESLVIFDDLDPSTEVIAKDIFDYVGAVLSTGFASESYTIEANRVTLERVRVWETPSSWAEYGV